MPDEPSGAVAVLVLSALGAVVLTGLIVLITRLFT